ncbi:MAG: lytic transglycosylase domain-containing protein [Proteobacteria bacterium]|nr:MAG: lytic transglycosylase domain-containing protein [Pseudomonadota bacterium]
MTLKPFHFKPVCCPINGMTAMALACLLLLGLCLSSAHAGNMKVYKHVDAQGIIHYSSKKPRGKSYHILNIRCPECSAWRNSVDWENTPLITDRYQIEIDHAADLHGIEKALLQAVIHAESAYKVAAVSSAGAQGLMQLMPLTQKTYAVNNPFNAKQNILGGAAYLKHLKSTYQNMDVYLAAYNSGETAVERYGRQIPPFPETKEYVRRVKILYKRYKQNQQRLNAFNNNQIITTGAAVTNSP